MEFVKLPKGDTFQIKGEARLFNGETHELMRAKNSGGEQN